MSRFACRPAGTHLKTLASLIALAGLLAACNGDSPSTPTSPTPTAPSAPTGLTATAGNGQVSLSWTAVAGATGYNVKRSTTNNGPYTQIASTTAPNHVDGTVTNGTQYFYVVSATNAGVEGGNSSQASATPGPPTFTLSGTVRNISNNQPIPGATVLIIDGPNINRSGTTDANGFYSIANLIQSGFTARATAPGFGTTQAGITLTSNFTANFFLVPTGGGGGGGGTAPSSVTGTWRGATRSTSCSSDGVYSGYCSANPSLPLAPFELRITQNGNSITGTVNAGGLIANVTGTITGNRLELTGSANQNRVNWDFEGWATFVSGNSMTGNYALRLTSQEGTGSGRVRYIMELVTVVRTATTTAEPAGLQSRGSGRMEAFPQP